MKEKEKLLTEQEQGNLFNSEDIEVYMQIDDYIESMKREDVIKLWYTVREAECSKWLEMLPVMPKRFENLNERKKYEWCNCIQDLCQLRVGLKALRRYQYMIEDGITGQEFEDLWDEKRAHLLEERMQELYESYCRRSDRNNETEGRDSGILLLSAFAGGFLLAFIAFIFVCAFAFGG